MYPNLKTERRRRKVTLKLMAALFSGRPATISYKIKHHKFYLEEALLIRDTFFPDCSIEYLFKTETEVKE